MAIVPAIIGGVIGLYGANKSKRAAEDAARTQNEAIEAQYQYNKQAHAMNKQKMLADRAYQVKVIEERARQEGQLAAFKDATAANQYNYQLQIRNKQQDTNERLFQKSEDIFKYQSDLNSLSEKSAQNDEFQKLQEIKAEKRYEKNQAYIDGLMAEGQIRARGQTGRSVDKARSVATLKAATSLSLLDLSLKNATIASNSALNEISKDRAVADLNAYARKMLDPGILPMPVAPLPTPQATFMLPRVYQDYDFGPDPIRGAMMNVSAAGAGAFGTSITSLAGAASQIATAITKSIA